jgi:hypothetical protein
MKPDYLTLSNGRKVRIEWNMHAMGEYVNITGRELLEFKSKKADLNTMKTIAWCSAVEGEICDGRELGMDETQFCRLMNMQSIVEFSRILTEQSTLATQKKRESHKSRWPRILTRRG